MRHAKSGGRIGYADGGSPFDNIRNHPLGAALLRVAGVDPNHTDEQAQQVLQKIEERKKRVVDPNEIWKINDPVERARQIAMLDKYNVDVSKDKPVTGGYYKVKQGMAPRDVQSTVGPIPGVTPKSPVHMSWEDALTTAAGGTLIGPRW